MSIHYIQIIDNRRDLSPLRKKCMDSLMSKKRDEDTYELIKVEYNPDPRKLIREIDRVKLLKAASIPNLCVVDTDCFIATAPDKFFTSENTPYFAPYGFNDHNKMPDIFYFYVNNSCSYFQQFLNPDKVLNPDGYSIDINSLKKLKGFKYIPEDSFLHTYETMSSVVVQQQMNDMIKEHESDKMELAMLRKSVEQMAMTMKTYENLRKAYHNG